MESSSNDIWRVLVYHDETKDKNLAYTALVEAKPHYQWVMMGYNAKRFNLPLPWTYYIVRAQVLDQPGERYIVKGQVLDEPGERVKWIHTSPMLGSPFQVTTYKTPLYPIPLPIGDLTGNFCHSLVVQSYDPGQSLRTNVINDAATFYETSFSYMGVAANYEFRHWVHNIDPIRKTPFDEYEQWEHLSLNQASSFPWGLPKAVSLNTFVQFRTREFVDLVKEFFNG